MERDEHFNLSYSSSGSRVWNWATTLTETTFQACTWNVIPAWAFEVTPNALQSEEEQQVSVPSVYWRVWWQGPGPPRARRPPCSSTPLCSSQPHKEQAGFIPSAAIPSSAVLQAGVKKLNLTAIKNTLSGLMPIVPLPLLYRIQGKSMIRFCLLQ